MQISNGEFVIHYNSAQKDVVVRLKSQMTDQPTTKIVICINKTLAYLQIRTKVTQQTICFLKAVKDTVLP